MTWKLPTKDKVLHLCTLVLGIFSGVLAVADKIKALPLPPWLTNAWGVAAIFAFSFRPTVLLIGDYLDDGQINQSFGGTVVSTPVVVNPVPIVTQPPSALQPDIKP